MFSLNEGLWTYLFNGSSEVVLGSVCYIGFFIIMILCAYFLGSINSAIIISKTLYHDDVRLHGSGNPGLTNMHRTFGLKAAGLTLLGDITKNVIAIFIGALFFGFNYVGGISAGNGFCYIAGLFAILGHVFPIYYKFKGGKGVLSTTTLALVLSPIPFLILFALFVLIVFFSKYISLGSVTAAILYPVLINAYFRFVFQMPPHGFISLTTVVLAILIVWCHRKNLQRISNKTENKFSFKRKKDEQ